MNALANSQKSELEKFLGKDQSRKVTFARYTGQENRADRDADPRQPTRHPADQLRDAGAHADPPEGARQPDPQRGEPVASWCLTSCIPTAAGRAPTSPC